MAIGAVGSIYTRVYEPSTPQPSNINPSSASASRTEQTSSLSPSIEASFAYQNALGLLINMHFLSVVFHFIREGLVQKEINPENFIKILENTAVGSFLEKLFFDRQTSDLSQKQFVNEIFNEWLNKPLPQKNQYPKEIRSYLHDKLQTRMNAYLEKNGQAESSSQGSRGISILHNDIFDFYKSIERDLFYPGEDYFSVCNRLEQQNIQKCIEESNPDQKSLFSQQISNAKSNLRHVPKEKIVERHFVEVDCSIKTRGDLLKQKKIYAKDLIQEVGIFISSTEDKENVLSHFMLFRGNGNITKKIANVARNALCLSKWSLKNEGILPFINSSDIKSFINDFKAFCRASPSMLNQPTFYEQPILSIVEVDCSIETRGDPLKQKKIYAKDLIEKMGIFISSTQDKENVLGNFMLFRGEGDITKKIAKVARGALAPSLSKWSLKNEGILPFINSSDVKSFINDFKAFRRASPSMLNQPTFYEQPILSTFLAQRDLPLPNN